MSRVPRIRGDDPIIAPLHLKICEVFPAYAGMIRGGRGGGGVRFGVPRIRGDDPQLDNENRTATSVPRIRGDDPYGCALFFEDKRVFPAYAG